MDYLIYILGAFLSIFFGSSTFLTKNISRYINGKRIQVNLDLVYDYFYMTFGSYIKESLNSFNESINDINEIPDYFVKDVTTKFVKSAPEILKGADFTKGTIRKSIDQEKVEEFVKGRISNFLD